MQLKVIPCLFVLVATISVPLFAAAEAEPPQSAFSLRWENDTFGGTDANYTNGMSAALTRPGTGLLGSVWNLVGATDGRTSTVYELTQFQFTPTNLWLTSPDPNDRPYAGLIYLGCTTHLQQEESLQSLKLLAGLVGPSSGAREAQDLAHKILGESASKGWSQQVDDEFIINLLYEYRHRYRLTPQAAAFGFDVIPMAGAFLGNYLIQAQSEVLIRFGYQLPDDFGTTSLRGIGYLPLPQTETPGHSWGSDLYVRGGANLVARNLTLDGNTFSHSRSVDKRPLVPAVEFGTALWMRQFMATISYQVWGREFANQPYREGYGSILLSVLF